MATVRVGLIGTGHWARTVHGPSVVRHPSTDLVGVWGHNQTHAAEAAAELGTQPYTDLDSLIGNSDALTFAVPPDIQAPIALRAAKLGRHLLLEKPIALSTPDALRLEQAATGANVASIVFFTRRFRPETRAWLQRVMELGGWYSGHAESNFKLINPGNPFGASAWRREHGALWDIGPHALAQLMPVLGEVTGVSAVAGIGDQVHLILRHAEGRSSTASFSYTSPTVAGNKMYVDGTAGRDEAPMNPLSSEDSIAAHQAALDALIEQSQHSKPSHPCDVHFGARVVEVLGAARQSAASGCLVSLSSSR